MAELTGKYAKLRNDLKIALLAGKSAERANPEDGGTCNFDSPTLILPRWRKALVKQAAKEAGSNCFEWKSFGVSGEFVFSTLTGGQGNARTRNAEAVKNMLKTMGYDASMYYQMD